MTHPGLDESELYDNDPPQVAPLFATMGAEAGASSVAQLEAEHPAKQQQDKGGSYLAAISAALDVLSYRLILLLSVLVAGGLFGLATWYPDPWRLGAAAAFSVIVVVPLTFFYARR